MNVRDRIKKLRRVKASELRPHPRNWRTHPDAQRDALRGLLSEIGYADALLVRELPDGTLQILDGHLRAETTPDQKVPVLVLDLDDAEADKLLALLDPLAAMAEPDEAALGALIAEIDTQSDGLRVLLQSLSTEHGAAKQDAESEPAADGAPVDDRWAVIVECADEADQQAVYEQLTREGRTCRPLTL